MQILNFTDHRRQLLQNRYVYAVVSRRAHGLSIGINLNVDKQCNFDCPYCQVDRTFPQEVVQGPANQGVDIARVQAELVHLLSLLKSGELWTVSPFTTATEEMRVLRDVSISGDGEPTICSNLLDVVSMIGEQLALFKLENVAFNLFSNATLFHKSRVQRALTALWKSNGRVWAKLDAGTQGWFERVDGTQLSLEKVTENILWAAQQHPIVLQCMFHRFGSERPSQTEIDAWVARIVRIVEAGGKIDWVQVYTTAREPSDSSVLPLSKMELDSIAASLKMLLQTCSPNTRITVTV